VAFVVELHDGYGRGWCRSEGSVLDVDGFVAVVVFVELGAEERSEVALEVSEITVEFQREVLWWGSCEGASARLAQAITVMNWPLMSRGILMEGVLSPSSCAIAHDGRDRTKRRAKAERRGACRDNDEPRSELLHGRDAVLWGFDAQQATMVSMG